jgi:hypothetical protein
MGSSLSPMGSLLMRPRLIRRDPMARRGVSSSGFRHVTTQRMKAPSTVANGLASG